MLNSSSAWDSLPPFVQMLSHLTCLHTGRSTLCAVLPLRGALPSLHITHILFSGLYLLPVSSVYCCKPPMFLTPLSNESHVAQHILIQHKSVHRPKPSTVCSRHGSRGKAQSKHKQQKLGWSGGLRLQDERFLSRKTG